MWFYRFYIYGICSYANINSIKIIQELDWIRDIFFENLQFTEAFQKTLSPK